MQQITQIMNSFSNGVSLADQQIQNQLALYKTPATIRDMKSVFFYVNVAATMTAINPLSLYYGIPLGLAEQQNVSSYYSPIGTERPFDIRDRIFELLDIRVPKDKYVVEINLADASLESDAAGWVSTPDFVAAKLDPTNPGGGYTISPTYNFALAYSGDPVINGTRDFISSFNQATKLTAPQTLFVRIKEMSNGEPYNWTVTNSGSYSIDKSHSLIVRHSDIVNTNLTLEFGHGLWLGRDTKAVQQIVDSTSEPFREEQCNVTVNPPSFPTPDQIGDNARQQQRPLGRYSTGDFVIVDYNTEVFNAYDNNVRVPPAPAIADTEDYAEFYKGVGGAAPAGSTDFFKGGKALPIGDPALRVPFIRGAVDGGGALATMLRQGRPYLYNQQVSKLMFRFVIKIIHLF